MLDLNTTALAAEALLAAVDHGLDAAAAQAAIKSPYSDNAVSPATALTILEDELDSAGIRLPPAARVFASIAALRRQRLRRPRPASRWPSWELGQLHHQRPVFAQ